MGVHVYWRFTSEEVWLWSRKSELRFHILWHERPISHQSHCKANRAEGVEYYDFVLHYSSYRFFEICQQEAGWYVSLSVIYVFPRSRLSDLSIVLPLQDKFFDSTGSLCLLKAARGRTRGKNINSAAAIQHATPMGYQPEDEKNCGKSLYLLVCLWFGDKYNVLL